MLPPSQKAVAVASATAALLSPPWAIAVAIASPEGERAGQRRAGKGSGFAQAAAVRSAWQAASGLDVCQSGRLELCVLLLLLPLARKAATPVHQLTHSQGGGGASLRHSTSDGAGELRDVGATLGNSKGISHGVCECGCLALAHSKASRLCKEACMGGGAQGRQQQ